MKLGLLEQYHIIAGTAQTPALCTDRMIHTLMNHGI